MLKASDGGGFDPSLGFVNIQDESIIVNTCCEVEGGGMIMNGSCYPSSHRLGDSLDEHAIGITTSLIHGEAGETGLLDILSLGSK